MEEVGMGDSAESKRRKGPRSKEGAKPIGVDEPCETDELIRAINHALRRQILRYLHSSRKPMSPKQIERKLGMSELRSGILSSVSYHVGVLRDFKAITLVGTKPRRGAVEHFYESTVSNSMWIRNLLKKTRERDQTLLWTARQRPSTKATGKARARNGG
jgi:DNA-binding transcriptional ArsR family regulator